MAPDLNAPSGSSAGAIDEAIVKVRGKDTNRKEEENEEDLVQYLLRHCYSPHEEGRTHYGPAVLGIAMVAMGEEVGLEMAIRSMEHLLRSDERNIRLPVPLALGLLCISNPKNCPRWFDHCAARMSSYGLHLRVPVPLHFLLPCFSHAAKNANDCGRESHAPICTCPCGRSFVGRAGRHKSVTDFQTFSTPVILPAGHRAELATDEYVPLSPILEGFFILKERPKHAEDPEASTREHE